MTPRYAWVFNLDAEFELTRRGYNTPTLLRDQLAKHGAASRGLMGPHDVLLRDATPPSAFVGRAWCPTPHALDAMRAAGVTPEPHPSADVLRRVNHRKFAFELGGGLPDQHYVTRREALDALFARRLPWLLKRPLAFAGRGQLRISAALDDKQRAWIDASLRDDGLIVEPLVTPALEVSLHGFVWRDGRHELGVVCEQRVDARGVFRDVVRAAPGRLDAAEHLAFTTQAHRVAEALHDAGYFGPFGIDGYRYEHGFCALGEINARYTMAFAIGFPRPSHELGHTTTNAEGKPLAR